MSTNQLPSIPGNGDIMSGDDDWMDKLKNDPAIDDQKWEKIDKYFETNSLAPVQQSIICEGQDCPFYKSCFLRRENIPLPQGTPCPIEETFKQRWAIELASSLGLAEDGFHSVDLGMVVDLINTQLDIHRAQSELVENPRMAERTIKGFDPQGNPLVDLKMNPTFFALKGARKLKTDILEALNATREARSKDAGRLTKDGAQMLTEFRKALEGGLNFGKIARDAEFDQPKIEGGVAHEHLDEHSKELGIKKVSDAPDLTEFEGE
jgi:hypothetical protein